MFVKLPKDDNDDTWNLLLCSPLFSVMQALVNSSIVDGNLDLINDAVLYLYSILRAIRKTEDAVDVQMTAVNYFHIFFFCYFLFALLYAY